MAPDKDYFRLLGLPFSYNLTEQVLEERYLSLQRQFHPDNFEEFAEKNWATSLSAELNAAYQTLRDPLLRALYLLKHQIKTLPEGSLLDEAFLMEQMTLREDIEEAAGKPLLLQTLYKNVKEKLSVLEQGLFLTFKEYPLAEEKVEKAMLLVQKIQFYQRLVERF